MVDIELAAFRTLDEFFICRIKLCFFFILDYLYQLVEIHWARGATGGESLSEFLGQDGAAMKQGEVLNCISLCCLREETWKLCLKSLSCSIAIHVLSLINKTTLQTNEAKILTIKDCVDTTLLTIHNGGPLNTKMFLNSSFVSFHRFI